MATTIVSRTEAMHAAYSLLLHARVKQWIHHKDVGSKPKIPAVAVRLVNEHHANPVETERFHRAFAHARVSV
eukprot:CAMPEP_0206133936 /NCGR_PEP_ID=MMETSP1472-20131121/54630_1 /ASSEMBLY_ACC=CAM_ASM_001108 /TAXON_ID=41880 /ORGANISM="Pycnococcus provasolii, Strain RCC251" /LENGTH=71 /DNA_ID=CAMNT_0053525535 /DNA_START=471 /DNA_END=683 /DNA_ORIENTATION=+